MPPVTNEESLKLLYGVLKLSNPKPSMAALGLFMGLEANTTRMRLYNLMKTLEKEHGEVDVQNLNSTASTTLNPKRKRAQKFDTPQKKSKAVANTNGDNGANIKEETGLDADNNA